MIGTILEAPKVEQMTKYGSSEPDYWPAGDPKLKIDLRVATDTGHGRLTLTPAMIRPVREAVRDAGAPGLAPGGVLAVHWAEGEGAARRYTADYEPPAEGWTPPPEPVASPPRKAQGSGTSPRKRNPGKAPPPAKTPPSSPGSTSSPPLEGGVAEAPTPFMFDSGATLLDHVETFIRRYCLLPTEAAYAAVALWAAHTHLYRAFETTPRLAALSPEAESGKSRVLEVLDLLVFRPEQFAAATISPIFRAIDAGGASILHDEIETVFGQGKEHEDLRALYNAGWRSSGRVLRSEPQGDTWVPKRYCAYAPVAVAGIDKTGTMLPDTIRSRAIVLHMRRRAPGERIEPFRIRTVTAPGHALRDQLAAWAATISTQATQAFPTMPDGIGDRQADIWEPLVVIADLAAGRWPDRARSACLEFATASQTRQPSLQLRLLGDVRTVFTRAGAELAMSTETILTELRKIEEAPWGDLRGRPLDARGLARMLRAYRDGDNKEIKSTKVKIDGRAVQGYRREDLHDAWSRYLPPPAPLSQEGEPTEPAEQGDVSAGQGTLAGFHSTPQVPEPATPEHFPIFDRIARQEANQP